MRNVWGIILCICLLASCKKGDTIINVNIDNSNEMEPQDPLLGKWTLTEVVGEELVVFYNNVPDNGEVTIASEKIKMEGKNITTTLEFKAEDLVYVKEGSYFFDLKLDLNTAIYESEVEVNFLSPQAHWEQIKDELILTRINGSDAVSTVLIQNKEKLMLDIPIIAGKKEGDSTNISITGNAIYTFEKK